MQSQYYNMDCFMFDQALFLTPFLKVIYLWSYSYCWDTTVCGINGQKAACMHIESQDLGRENYLPNQNLQ